MPKTTLPHAYRAVADHLAIQRHDLEFGPSSIAQVLILAGELLHACEMATAAPSPLATEGNISALVDCARMAADLLSRKIGVIFDAMDAAGGAE